VVAVRGVDINVAEGEVVAVLGANGAGKSSLLRAIAGAIKPAAGEVTYQGHRIDGRPAYRQVREGLVLVPEGRRILAPLSVEENLLLGAYCRRSRSQTAATLERVYSLFPLVAQRRRVAGGVLSGGEQQMLALGRALMADHKVMLMDEPSMGLAPVMVHVVMKAVEDIARQGIAVVMVEQNAVAALKRARRAYVLDRGRVVAQGTAAEVAAMPAVIEAFLGLAPGVDAAGRPATLAVQGASGQPELSQHG
jgi:branched-chain amino acid transport system ATP-binding protein